MISNWGRYPEIDAEIVNVRRPQEVAVALDGVSPMIARGAGRCYGDSALAQRIVSMRQLNKFISFDQKTGELVVEAGVMLAEIVDHFLPRGWFLPVTPGTKFVTVGGAIASDVHGKNHHLAGSFSRQLNWFEIVMADGEIRRCSRTENKDLYWATCGGMGLTGVVLRASLPLKPVASAYINQRLTRAENLEEVMAAFETEAQTPYSVAWIDCLAKGDTLGRSLLMAGDHVQPNTDNVRGQELSLLLPRKRTWKIPIDFPNLALNQLTVKAFNQLYFGKAPKGVTSSLVDINAFFYPLDAIGEWNRIYGKRGFTQYQFVLPQDASYEGLRIILEKIAASGQGSFLAVLKLFGDHEEDGLLSFPLRGYTLALDFAINRTLFPLLDELDRVVIDLGGRLYLTKDVRMSRAVFERGYGSRVDRFRELREAFDPQKKFMSLQAERVGL